MKKVLIINDLIMGGGVEVVMKNIAEYLSNKDYHVTIMTYEDDVKKFKENFSSSISYEVVKHANNPYQRFSVPWFFKKIKMLMYPYTLALRKEDIVIAIKEGPCMKLAHHFRTKNKFAWIHVDYQTLYWTKYAFGSEAKELNCMKHFKKVVCVSNRAKDSVKKVIGDPGNLCVKYSPIDYRSIANKANEPLSREEKPLFVAVGRLCKEKNYQMLVEVAIKLHEHYDFNLWIVGEGEERAQLERLINEHQAYYITLLGKQSNPYPYFKQADCFVASSISESYGLAVQEAFILEVPVISTKCPALEEVFDLRCGQLVDCHAEALYTGLKELLDQPEKLKMYKDNIRQYYPKESLWEERFLLIEKLWEEN